MSNKIEILSNEFQYNLIQFIKNKKYIFDEMISQFLNGNYTLKQVEVKNCSVLDATDYIELENEDYATWCLLNEIKGEIDGVFFNFIQDKEMKKIINALYGRNETLLVKEVFPKLSKIFSHILLYFIQQMSDLFSYIVSTKMSYDYLGAILETFLYEYLNEELCYVLRFSFSNEAGNNFNFYTIYVPRINNINMILNSI